MLEFHVKRVKYIDWAVDLCQGVAQFIGKDFGKLMDGDHEKLKTSLIDYFIISNFIYNLPLGWMNANFDDKQSNSEFKMRKISKVLLK